MRLLTRGQRARSSGSLWRADTDLAAGSKQLVPVTRSRLFDAANHGFRIVFPSDDQAGTPGWLRLSAESWFACEPQPVCRHRAQPGKQVAATRVLFSRRDPRVFRRPAECTPETGIGGVTLPALFCPLARRSSLVISSSGEDQQWRRVSVVDMEFDGDWCGESPSVCNRVPGFNYVMALR